MAKKKESKGKKRQATETSRDLYFEQSNIRQHLLALILLSVISVGLFAPIHFSGKKLVATDTVSWRAMAQAMLEHQEETGEEALWSPNLFGGMPGYLISVRPSVPQIDDIATELRPLIWPTSHFIFLLFGTYLLCFVLTRNSLASVFGACAFGLTNYVPLILTAGHNSKFIALCFAPWLVLTFIYLMRKPGWLGCALFAIAAAANLRAGHIQVTYYFTAIIFIWWLVEGIGLIRSKQAGQFVKATSFLLLGTIAALALVAQPYLAKLEYKDYSIRGSGDGGAGPAWEYAMGWSQGRLEMLTLLIAGAAGGDTSYWGPKIATAGPHYFGALSVVFALIAFLKKRDATVVALSVAALVTIAFALGKNLEPFNRAAFDWLPMYSALRVPETWLSTTAFLVAVLGSIGVAGTLAAFKGKREGKRFPRYALIPVAALGAFLLVLLVGKDGFLTFEKENETAIVAQQIARANNVPVSDPRVASAADEYVQEQREPRRRMFANDTLRSFLVVALAGLLIWLLYKGLVPDSVFVGLLIIVQIFDLGGVSRRYLNSSMLVEQSVNEPEVPEYGFDRFIVERVDESGGPGHFRTLSLERNPTSNARPAYYYETVGGYHAAKLGIYQDYLDKILFGQRTFAPTPIGLDLMNVRYIVAGSQLAGLDSVYHDQETGLRVFEKKNVLPRAYFVSDYEVVANYDEALVALGSVDIRTRVILEEDPGIAEAPVDSNSVATATVVQHTPRTVTIEAETDAERMLVVSEVHYPAGWTATVDGRPAPIFRANSLVRAVRVPAGTSTIEFKFHPQKHFLGRTISLAATILIYGFVIIALVFAVWKRGSDIQSI